MMLKVEMSFYTNDGCIRTICHLQGMSPLHADAAKVEEVMTSLIGYESPANKFEYNREFKLKASAIVAGKHLLESISDFVEMSQPVKDLLKQVEEYYDTPTQEKLHDIDLSEENVLDYVKVKPYDDYQLNAPIHALQRDKFLVYWATGTGKTFALALMMSYLDKHNEGLKHVIISSTPGSKNVASSLNDFLDMSKYKTYTFENAKHVHSFEKDRQDYDILVFSYSAYKTFLSDNKNKVWFNKHFGKYALYLDEVQGANNVKSQQSKDVFRAAKKAFKIYMFSATPYDSPAKMYAIMKLLDPKAVYDLPLYHWSHIYAKSNEKFGRNVIDNKTWRTDLIQKRFAFISQSIDEKGYEVLDLPDQEIVQLKFSVPKDLEEIYHESINDLMKNVHQDAGLSSVFIRSLGILANPEDLVKNAEFALSGKSKSLISQYDITKSPKFTALKFLVKDCNKKPIVWYAHPSVGNKALDFLKNEGKKVYFVCAEMENEERNTTLQKFIDDEDQSVVLLTSLYLTTTSITLNCSKVMIFLDHVFKYEDRVQALGRNHRIGQDQVTKVYDLYYQDTVDMSYYARDLYKEDYIKKYSAKDNINLDVLKSLLNGRVESFAKHS